MKSKKCIVFLWVLAILPLILTAAVYSRLPEQIPMQWGIDGEISRYGGKGEIWMIAGLGPFLALLFQFLPSLDPKKRSYEQFQIYYEAFALVTEAFFAVVTGLILAETMKPGTVSMGRAVSALVGLLILFIGRILGKVKTNFFLGIRTPWTLSDPEVWDRTHRLGGILFSAAGLAAVIAALFLPEAAAFWVLMGGIGIAALIPVVMSCIWYRSRKKDKNMAE